MTSQHISYREVAEEAITNLEKVAYLVKEGKNGLLFVAPVIAEHNGAITQKQQDTADMQTMRARLVAATLYLGLPAREATMDYHSP